MRLTARLATAFAFVACGALPHAGYAANGAVAEVFALGRGFAAGVAAAHPQSSVVQGRSSMQTPNVSTVVFRNGSTVLPVSVAATSLRGVQSVSKDLSEMNLAAVRAIFGEPDSQTGSLLRYRGPAESCEEYLELRFEGQHLASAKWLFCGE